MSGVLKEGAELDTVLGDIQGQSATHKSLGEQEGHIHSSRPGT